MNSRSVRDLSTVRRVVGSVRSRGIKLRASSNISTRGALPCRACLSGVENRVPVLNSESPRKAGGPPPDICRALFDKLMSPDGAVLSHGVRRRVTRRSGRTILTVSRALRTCFANFCTRRIRRYNGGVRGFLTARRQVEFNSALMVLLLTLAGTIIKDCYVGAHQAPKLLYYYLTFALLKKKLCLNRTCRITSKITDNTVYSCVHSLPSRAAPVTRLGLANRRMFSVVSRYSHKGSLIRTFRTDKIGRVRFGSIAVVTRPACLGFLAQRGIGGPRKSTGNRTSRSADTARRGVEQLRFSRGNQTSCSGLVTQFLRRGVTAVPLRVAAALTPLVGNLAADDGILGSLSLRLGQIGRLLSVLGDVMSRSSRITRQVQSTIVATIRRPVVR